MARWGSVVICKALTILFSKKITKTDWEKALKKKKTQTNNVSALHLFLQQFLILWAESTWQMLMSTGTKLSDLFWGWEASPDAPWAMRDSEQIPEWFQQSKQDPAWFSKPWALVALFPQTQLERRVLPPWLFFHLKRFQVPCWCLAWQITHHSIFPSSQMLQPS